MIFAPYVVNDFNRNVAEKNIAAKYDSSKLKFIYWGAGEKLVKATYTDKNSNSREDILFAFENGDTEPFLVKSYITPENFSKIEKAISKSE